jgi:glycosyltransferase involved in cell wall biosynthesis
MRLCLIGHSAEGLFGSTPGGSERQLALLATSLAGRGHQVTMVIPGYGDAEGEVRGVKVRSGWDDSRGVRYVRAFTYRYAHFKRVLRDLHADAYYARGVSLSAVSAVTAARQVGSVSLLALCSDRDLFPDSGRYNFSGGNPNVARLTGRLGYEYFRRRGLRRTGCVIVQNTDQASACAAAHLPHRLLPSIVPPPPAAICGSRVECDAVWVGNMGYATRRPKGVAELAVLAERLPHVRFAIVGRLEAPQLRDVVARLRTMPNVVLHGRQEHERTLKLIASSRVVLNTSPSEGFSNVMLEGWSLRKPVVSLSVDPNRLLSGGRLGLCGGGSIDLMAEGLGRLLVDELALTAMGEAAFAYVNRVHAADAVCERFENLVVTLAERR